MKKIYPFFIIIILILIVVFVLTGKKPVQSPEVEPVDTTTSQKIDINAVCEGALAYMTFADGASAELFVSECKEGKHPQVIEDWKKNQGIQYDRAI